jgi:hypothetical protein
MQGTPTHPPVKPRFIALDVVKGFVMVVMANIHAAFFFSEQITWIPFKYFDPFVFSTFLLCFGVGNGLSRRLKRLDVLGKLLLVYFVGALPSVIVSILLKKGTANWYEVLALGMQQWGNAITLQGRLAYADFLVPFMIAYIVFWCVQSLFREFNQRTLIIFLLLSIGFYTAGYWLSQVAPNALFSDFYNKGFRTLQSVPIFLAGVCFGLFLQRYQQKILPLQRSTWVGIAITFLGLISISYLKYERYLYGTQGWKKSGELSYLVMSILVPLLLLFTTEGLIQLPLIQQFFTALIAGLKTIGERTLKCLWLQFILLPIVGYVASRYLAEPLRVLLALLTISIVCWLTATNRLLFLPSPQKKSV